MSLFFCLGSALNYCVLDCPQVTAACFELEKSQFTESLLNIWTSLVSLAGSGLLWDKDRDAVLGSRPTRLDRNDGLFEFLGLVCACYNIVIIIQWSTINHSRRQGPDSRCGDCPTVIAIERCRQSLALSALVL